MKPACRDFLCSATVAVAGTGLVVAGTELMVGTGLEFWLGRAFPIARIFLVFLIVVWCWASHRYFHPHLVAARQLDVAKRRILDESGSESADFTLFANHDALGEAWKRFLDARCAGALDTPHSQPASSAAADFLTVDSVLGARRSKLPNALSGVFTATGLLGTFVGIAFGLRDIDLDADSGERLEGIGQLMEGMSTAFLTSIIGITLSIVWLILWRYLDRKLESSLENFLQQTNKKFPIEDPHEILGRIGTSVAALGELGETAKGIKGSIQQLGDDLSGAFESHLQAYVAEPLQSLNADLGQSQQEALERMVASFQTTLASAVGENLNAFGEALRTATDYQVKTATKLDRFFDRLEEVADTQTKLLDRTSEVAEVFESGMARLLEAKKAIREAGRSARVTMAAAQSLSQECRHLLGAQKKASDARVKAMERLESDLRNLTSHLTEKVEDYRSLSAQKIEEVFQLFDSEMAKITDHLSGTMDEMRDVAETLLRITQELPAAVKRLDHTTAEAVQTLDHAIKELARSETAQQESVTDGIRVFDQASARLSDGLEELAKVRTAFGTLPDLARTMHSSNERTAKAIEQLGAHLDSLATKAEESGGRMLEKLAAVAEKAGAASSQIEPSIATSTDTAAPREARDRRPAGGGPEPDPEPDADDDSAKEPDPRKGRRWRWPLWRRR